MVKITSKLLLNILHQLVVSRYKSHRPTQVTTWDRHMIHHCVIIEIPTLSFTTCTGTRVSHVSCCDPTPHWLQLPRSCHPSGICFHHPRGYTNILTYQPSNRNLTLAVFGPPVGGNPSDADPTPKSRCLFDPFLSGATPCSFDIEEMHSLYSLLL